MRLCLAALIFLGTSIAHADEAYSFVVTSTYSGMPFTVTGTFIGHFDTTYTGDPAYNGLFDITSLQNGKLNQTSITLISAAPNVTPIGSTYFPGAFGGFYYDDILFPNAITNTVSHELIDNAGILFFDGTEYFDIYYTYADPTYELAFSGNAQDGYANDGYFGPVDFTLTPLGQTPEPGTDVLVATGLAWLVSLTRKEASGVVVIA